MTTIAGLIFKTLSAFAPDATLFFAVGDPGMALLPPKTAVQTILPGGPGPQGGQGFGAPSNGREFRPGVGESAEAAGEGVTAAVL